MSRVLRGTSGAPGLASGTIARVDQIDQVGASPATPTLTPDAALAQFSAAQHTVHAELEALAMELRAENKDAEAAIFDAQALLAIDSALTSGVEQALHDGLALPDAITRAADQMATVLADLPDPYLRERAADVRAVASQLVTALSGGSTARALPDQAIVVARDLTPAQTAGLRKANIAGIATVGGTATGHVAILARALDLPAIVGVGDDLLDLPDGTPAILDADAGQLIVEPDAAERDAAEQRSAARRTAEHARRALIDVPATTRDGQRISLWANIGHPDEAGRGRELGAEGVGLFRTEFLFLDRATPPSEDEQRIAYAAALDAMDGRPVIVRTIDIGGDKPIPYLPQLHETNPFLGWRGVRFAMRFPDLFRAQLRALLRAATAGDLRIMLPMIATPDDVAWARAEIAAAADALAHDGVAHRADVPLGIMIETPAAAVTLDRLIDQISFCSIGSNDLAQYTLAVDRSAGDLAARYRHNDPAVLRLIRTVAQDAGRLGLELSVCGELASEPRMAIALVGMGITKLSMTPIALLDVKAALRDITLDEARQAATQACGNTTP